MTTRAQITKKEAHKKHGGGTGSGSRSAKVSNPWPVDVTNKPTLGDIEDILKKPGGLIKCEGTPPPIDEHFRAITWISKRNDRLYILMPPGKDYETLVKIRDYLRTIFEQSRAAALSRATDGVLREFPNISIHFNTGKKAHDEIAEADIKVMTIKEYDESISRAEAAVRKSKELLAELTPKLLG